MCVHTQSAPRHWELVMAHDAIVHRLWSAYVYAPRLLDVPIRTQTLRTTHDTRGNSARPVKCLYALRHCELPVTRDAPKREIRDVPTQLAPWKSISSSAMHIHWRNDLLPTQVISTSPRIRRTGRTWAMPGTLRQGVLSASISRQTCSQWTNCTARLRQRAGHSSGRNAIHGSGTDKPEGRTNLSALFSHAAYPFREFGIPD